MKETKKYVKKSLLLGGGLLVGSVVASKVAGAGSGAGVAAVESGVQTGLEVGAVAMPIMGAGYLMGSMKKLTDATKPKKKRRGFL